MAKYKNHLLPALLVVTLLVSPSISAVTLDQETVDTSDSTVSSNSDNGSDMTTSSSTSTETESSETPEAVPDSNQDSSDTPQVVSPAEEEVVSEKGQSSEDDILADWNYTEYQDGYLLENYKGTETTITIPGKINGKQVYVSAATKFLSSTISVTFQETDSGKVKVADTSLKKLFPAL